MNQKSQNKFLMFFKGLPDKFKVMPLEEKLAYGAIVLGVLLIVVSMFLF